MLRTFATHTHRHYKEYKIPVPWGHVAAKWWEPFDTRPILTIHGWQDNSGSFDRLIPLLTPTRGFMAIDLPGHGRSSRIPDGFYYHNINYPILVRQLANHHGWDKVSLMGHSLGAITCFVYTCLYPHDVDLTICIDGLKPLRKKNNIQRIGTGIDELLKYDSLNRSGAEPPSYTLETLRKKISGGNDNSIRLDCSDFLLSRNIAPSKLDPTKFYLTRDPRLKSRLILNWPQSDLVEGAKRLVAPLCLVKFTGSGFFEEPHNFDQINDELTKHPKYEFHRVDGTHHTHLNDPERLTGLVNDFIDKYS